MAEKEAPVKIVRAEYLKRMLPPEVPRFGVVGPAILPPAPEAARVRMYPVMRKELGLKPMEEGVVVTIGAKRERWKGDRKIEWWDRYTRDHLHIDIQKFRDLLDKKKAAGLSLTVSDAVEAYLLIWGYGSKSVVAAFIWAMGSEYPELRTKHEEVRTPVTITPLFGPPREEVKVSRVARPIGSADELVGTVGQVLSRLRGEGVILG